MTHQMGDLLKSVCLITLLPGSPCYLGGSFDADLCSDTCNAVNVGRDAIKKVLFGNDSMVFQVFGTELKVSKNIVGLMDRISRLDRNNRRCHESCFENCKRPPVKR